MKIFDKATNMLKWCTWVNLSILVFAAMGMLVDDRTLLGENVWHKPLKFAISIPIYCVTIALLLKVYPYSFKQKRWISRIIGWALILEVPLVMIQAYRGVRSHFNFETAFDGAIFGWMGILILINTLVLFYMMFSAFFKKLDTSIVMQRAIQFGWLAMIISIIAGQLMINNNAHSVGIVDGGTGMPITHWNTEGGDLRAVHFLGMHGIQLLPLLALLFTKRQATNSTLWIWVAGIAYLSFIAYIFVRTQAGLPFLAV